MPQTLTTNATNLVANPQVVNDIGASSNRPHVAFERITIPDTANADTHITGVKLPVDARVISVRFGCDDLGTAGTIDLGLFRRDGLNSSTFTVVNANCIANNIDVATAAVATAERLVVANLGQRAWQIAGLSARPDYDHLFVGITTDTGTTAAGAGVVLVEFLID